MDEITNIKTKKNDIKQSKVIVEAAAQVIYADRLEMESKVHNLKMRKFVRGALDGTNGETRENS